MRNLLLPLCLLPALVLLGSSLPAQEVQDNQTEGPALPAITERFPLKWEARVGLTTYRTNMLYAGGQLLIPSNGTSLASLLDAEDGLHILDPATGAQLLRLQPTASGDTDVNGVAYHQGVAYFGNDKGEVFAYLLPEGRQLWKTTLQGDIEGSPMLMDVNGDGSPDAVVATEEPATVQALDGASGAVLWRFDAVDRGYFMATPNALDITDDGVPDVLIGLAGGNTFYAINGKTGKLLWRHKTIAASGRGSGIHASALVLLGTDPTDETDDTDDTPRQEPLIVIPEAYGQLHFITRRGQPQRFAASPIGVFSSPVMSPGGSIVHGLSWFFEESATCYQLAHSPAWQEGDYGSIILKNGRTKNFTNLGRISASAFVADVLGDGTQQFGLVSEDGILLLLDERGEELARYALPSGAEATPLVADIDGDGLAELLIACLNGKLYCYETGGPARSIHWGSFRHNPTNLVQLTAGPGLQVDYGQE